MRRLQITMTDELVQALMERSRRSRVAISQLVVQAVQAWLGSQTAPKNTTGGYKRISCPCSQGKRRRTPSKDATEH